MSVLSSDPSRYRCHWRHGPAPGLTYYDGVEEVYADDEEDAVQRAKRALFRRACFEPGCITVYRVEAV